MKARRFSARWRRRTTSRPEDGLRPPGLAFRRGCHLRPPVRLLDRPSSASSGLHGAKVYHRRHAWLERVGRARRAAPLAPPKRPRCSLATWRLCRPRNCVRPPRSSPAGRSPKRTSGPSDWAGRRSPPSSAGWPMRPPARSAKPTTDHPTWARPSPRCSPCAPMQPGPGRLAEPGRSGRGVRRDRGAPPGPRPRARSLPRCWTAATPLTAKYVVKVLTGELRIGLREGLLEAAIAEAFGRPQADVGMALMLTGDTGETAVLAKEDRLHEARLRLLHPIKFMLASPAEDAAEILGAPRAHGLGGGQVRRHPGPASSPRLRGPALQPRPPRHQRPDSRDRRGGPAARLGRHPRRRDPGLCRRPRPAVPDAPGPPRPQGPERSGPGRGARHLRRLRPAGDRAAVASRTCQRITATAPRRSRRPSPRRSASRQRHIGRCCRSSATPLAERRGRLEALDLPTVADGGRFALSH